MDKIIEQLAEHSAGSNNNAFERAEHIALTSFSPDLTELIAELTEIKDKMI